MLKFFFPPQILNQKEEKQDREFQLGGYTGPRGEIIKTAAETVICFHFTGIYPLFAQNGLCENTRDRGFLLSGPGFGVENNPNHDILYIDWSNVLSKTMANLLIFTQSFPYYSHLHAADPLLHVVQSSQ